MSGLIRPEHVVTNTEDRTSKLFFPDGSSENYYMRGGICWPTAYKLNGLLDMHGFVLMAGMNTRTGVVKVFEQEQFTNIEHFLDQFTGVIEIPGLAPWFNTVWNRYFGRKYFWFQNQETNKQFMLEVKRSSLIQPKPVFKEIHWSTDEDARHVVWQAVKRGKLEIEKDSILGNQLLAAERGHKDLLPAVHALTCCLAGMARYPWRPRR